MTYIEPACEARASCEAHGNGECLCWSYEISLSGRVYQDGLSWQQALKNIAVLHKKGLAPVLVGYLWGGWDGTYVKVAAE